MHDSVYSKRQIAFNKLYTTDSNEPFMLVASTRKRKNFQENPQITHRKRRIKQISKKQQTPKTRSNFHHSKTQIQTPIFKISNTKSTRAPPHRLQVPEFPLNLRQNLQITDSAWRAQHKYALSSVSHKNSRKSCATFQ